MIPIRRAMLVALLLASSVAAACGDSNLPTVPTTTGSNQVTEVFSGTIAPGETKFYSFTMPSSLPLRIGLGSLVDANGNPLSTQMKIGFGVPSATGCGLLQTATAAPSLATNINLLITPGVYCVSIADAGQLAASSVFGVRITFGDPSATASGGTLTYASTLLPGGSTSRTFDATAAGTVTVILDTIDQPSVETLGLGLGFPRTDGGGCQLNQTFVASRGSQFAVPVEAGKYCLKVYDLATLPDVTRFSLRIVYP